MGLAQVVGIARLSQSVEPILATPEALKAFLWTAAETQETLRS